MKLIDALTEVFDKHYTVPINRKGVTKKSLLEFIASGKPCKGVFGYSHAGWDKFIKKCFPDKKNSSRYRTFLLRKAELKYCTQCETVRDITFFNKNITKSDGLSLNCRYCRTEKEANYRVYNSAKNRARLRNRTPGWSEEKLIREFYVDRLEGYHVDHIIPLQGEKVSGLHVISNLQYLTAEENIKKSNKYIVD